VQWNAFRTVQLDSYAGLTISRDRLTRLLGGTLEVLKGKLVLEAGCGAGRFTEVLLNAGAHVFAVDLSSTVEANYENCKQSRNYFVRQADILYLHFLREQFDVVVSIGVIQHTPNPEKTISALYSQVKPGGLLVFDHYTCGYPVIPSRHLLRFLLLRIPADFAIWFCKALVAILWPLHKLLWKFRHYRGISKLGHGFLYLSPVVDYHEAYAQLGPDLLRAWAILETHDALTDVYKHLRSAEEIASYLQQCGMRDIETVYAGNGVEARARKPVNTPSVSGSAIQRTNRSSY
jgi:SAM-dependent methyltransferase